MTPSLNETVVDEVVSTLDIANPLLESAKQKRLELRSIGVEWHQSSTSVLMPVRRKWE
jgi:hypothetical protein